MPTASRSPVLLVDTSAAVPLLTVDHEHHPLVFDAIADRRLGLAGHAAFETFSALTRRPAPNRMSPQAALDVLNDNFPHTRHLGSDAGAQLLSRLAATNVAGGAVYDALVAAVAVEHGLALATRDRRALGIYRELGAEVLLL